VKKYTYWIASRPVLAFLVLAFAISWIGWALSDRIDLGLANGFGVIGSAGPALAATTYTMLQPRISTRLAHVVAVRAGNHGVGVAIPTDLLIV
jgi:hypothetical protein